MADQQAALNQVGQAAEPSPGQVAQRTGRAQARGKAHQLRFLVRFPDETGVIAQDIYCFAVKIGAGDDPDVVTRQACAYIARARAREGSDGAPSRF